jgi:hypothetical protein
MRASNGRTSGARRSSRRNSPSNRARFVAHIASAIASSGAAYELRTAIGAKPCTSGRNAIRPLLCTATCPGPYVAVLPDGPAVRAGQLQPRAERPTNNFFVPNPPAAAPTAYGPPMIPMVPMMDPPMPPAFAPPVPALVTGSSVSMPTSRSTARVRVRGPSLLGTGLARLGERLTQLGRTRVETVHETVLEN